MLSENIKTLRKQKGYSQEQLADKLCVVRQTVSKWEKGYSVPDADMLEDIADIAGDNGNKLVQGVNNLINGLGFTDVATGETTYLNLLPADFFEKIAKMETKRVTTRQTANK